MKRNLLIAPAILSAWAASAYALISFTNSSYYIQLNSAGSIYTINYPLGSLDHIFHIKSMLNHMGGSRELNMFNVLAPVGLVGNVATSYISNGEAAIAIRTTFHETYIEQQFNIRNVTNTPLYYTRFYRYQDGDVGVLPSNDLVGREPVTRLMYQTDSNVWIGLSMYASYMSLPHYYMGGYFHDVLDAIASNRLTQTIVQTNDTAVAVGILYATFFPGQSFTMTTRTILSTNGVDMLAEHALPYTTGPGVKKLKFGVNFAKQNKDTMSFIINLSPVPVMITNLADSIAYIYTGNYIVINDPATDSKVSKRGTMAVYEKEEAKVKLKINTAKPKAVMKVKVKKADIASYLGIQNDGQPGTLELPVLFYLNTTNLIGHETVTVPYTNKQDKKAKGKQQ
jgi:hypothetical protein